MSSSSPPSSFSSPSSSSSSPSLSVVEDPDVVYEYGSVSNPSMSEVPIAVHPADLHQKGATRVTPFDLSKELHLPYPASSPNLLVAFIRIVRGESITTTANATSQGFFVIRGRGSTRVNAVQRAEEEKQSTSSSSSDVIQWSTGDLFVVPFSPGQSMEHSADDVEVEHGGAALYWIHDAPLLSYLRVTPTEAAFRATKFTRQFLVDRVEQLRHDPKASSSNRLGVLLANEATKHETKTLTHVLWSLLNVLPADTVQAPHRHNSVALDLCISSSPSSYTLMGKQLNSDGEIIDPVKVQWSAGSAFSTPPGWWHSHVNEDKDKGNDSWVLPLQDAGLVTHQRILDIRFAPDEVEQLKQQRLTGISLNLHVANVGEGAN